MADAHFKYLMAAGLQKNISLKEIIFVNPVLEEDHLHKRILEEKIFGVFREDLKEKGIIKFFGLKAWQFLLHPGVSSILNRGYPRISGTPGRFPQPQSIPGAVQIPYINPLDLIDPLLPS